MTDPATRYGHLLVEVPWRHGRHRKEQVYAQHGPIPTDEDRWVLMAADPAIAGYIVRMHNADIERVKRAERKR